ncbi:hypothetical protein AUK22_08510 [bacterium CG2_30_54_10]|nr:MAG: hypothetical protein AUK22_08510 [bacterium CG2_30_54_10]
MEKSKTFLFVKKNWCKKCGICVEFCPKGVFKLGKDGYPEIVALDKCVECKLCISLCPDFAIFSNPEKKKDYEDR